MDKLVVWGTHRWEKQHAFTGHAEPLRTAAFHPNGKQFVTADRASIFLWDVTSGEQLGSLSKEVTLADCFPLQRGFTGNPTSLQTAVQGSRELYSIAFSTLRYFFGWWIIPVTFVLWDAATLEPCMGMILPESCSRVGVVVFFAMWSVSCLRFLVEKNR